MGAKLFAIRCSISQATSIYGITKIIIITDSLHTTQRIFDFLLHSFQLYTAAILDEFRRFFLKGHNYSIKFWECPSCCNWSLHKVVDKETKQFHPIPQYSYKSSWDFSKKSKSDNILFIWEMIFQALDLKGHQFLDLCNNDNNPLEPLSLKGEI